MPSGKSASERHVVVIALAKAINRRRLELARLRPGASYKITPTASRILENDPDYLPYRERAEDKKRKPSRNPGIVTIKKFATDLETTVGHLLGERGFELSTDDRRRLLDVVRFLTVTFRLDAIDEAPSEATSERASDFLFPVSASEFIPRDHDYPRNLHAWVVPEHNSMAGPTGFEEDLSLRTTDILHSIREVRTGRVQVVRVVGDSMADVLKNGWKVLVDTSQTTPSEGDLVAVYLKDEGSLLGYWHRRSHRVEIRKANPDYDPVILGSPDEWIVWGKVTTIVEAPL